MGMEMGGREGGREIRAGVPLGVPAFSMWSENSDGHDQIMIEFCSTMICSISFIHRVPLSEYDRAEHL